MGDYILSIHKWNNNWHLFKVTEKFGASGVDAILVDTSSNLIRSMISKDVYLSKIYFDDDNGCITKIINHKPTNDEILAMIL